MRKDHIPYKTSSYRIIVPKLHVSLINDIHTKYISKIIRQKV